MVLNTDEKDFLGFVETGKWRWREFLPIETYNTNGRSDLYKVIDLLIKKGYAFYASQGESRAIAGFGSKSVFNERVGIAATICKAALNLVRSELYKKRESENTNHHFQIWQIGNNKTSKEGKNESINDSPCNSIR